MYSRIFRIGLCFLIALAPLTGCQSVNQVEPVLPLAPFSDDVPSPGDSYLSPSEPVGIGDTPIEFSMSPDQVVDYGQIEHLPISLEECIQSALADSKVFRDLGGAIIFAPVTAETTLDPALIYSNPIIGEDAALSAFDAQYAQSVFFEKNDRAFNTSFTGDTNGIFQQDLGEFNFELSKLSATGTRFSTRAIVNYDDNNQAGNRFFHSWESIAEGEFRHPFLQGGGVLFNRIAGPSQSPGNFNGILIARTNTEISLADFQASVRDFIVNVENAYWDLYYAYRELNAQTDARDAAYEVYKKAQAEVAEERVSALEEASAYEQFLRFENAVYQSLEGRPTEGTQAGSGSAGGVFRRNVGVRIAERRLRYLIGKSITDGLLLQPSDQPDTTPVVFDWNESFCSALDNRPETRRQKWVVKQRQLQLTAAKNFLLPRLDFVGRYRFRGLGRDLTGGESFQAVIDSPNNNDDVSGALKDLGSGNFQEWQLGLEMRMPVGFRKANAGVRNAELGLERARYVLTEQERRIALELSNAVAEVHRSPVAMSLAEQRYNAAVDYRTLADERILGGRAQFDVLLEAQRRVLESQIQFINAEVENTLAVRNVHFERGSLLKYHGISLAESESDPGAYESASRRQANRKRPMNYIQRNPVIARPIQNDTLPNAAHGEVVSTGFVQHDTPENQGNVAITNGGGFSNVVVTETGPVEQHQHRRVPSNNAPTPSFTNPDALLNNVVGEIQPATAQSARPAAPVPTQSFSDETRLGPPTPTQQLPPNRFIPNRRPANRSVESEGTFSNIIAPKRNTTRTQGRQSAIRSAEVRATFRNDAPLKPVKNLTDGMSDRQSVSATFSDISPANNPASGFQPLRPNLTTGNQ
jgi:outer membrane protein TolC